MYPSVRNNEKSNSEASQGISQDCEHYPMDNKNFKQGPNMAEYLIFVYTVNSKFSREFYFRE